jgi:hypothetical protein
VVAAGGGLRDSVEGPAPVSPFQHYGSVHILADVASHQDGSAATVHGLSLPQLPLVEDLSDREREVLSYLPTIDLGV